MTNKNHEEEDLLYPIGTIVKNSFTHVFKEEKEEAKDKDTVRVEEEKEEAKDKDSVIAEEAKEEAEDEDSDVEPIVFFEVDDTSQVEQEEKDKTCSHSSISK